MDFLNEREETVLKTIIDMYVDSNEPVGSRNVSRTGPLKMSPATIRNIMSDLEEKGLIIQPHTSAGRVPTDQGYRYYIDRLVRFDGMTEEMTQHVQNVMHVNPANMNDLFREFGKRLSTLTGSVGFVLSPKLSTMYLKHIEFLRLSRSKVLAILVTRTGIVNNVLLEIDETVTESDLTRISNYLSAQFNGKTLQDIRTHLLHDLKHQKHHLDNLTAHLELIGKNMFSAENMYDDFIIEGTSNILSAPEFTDVTKLREFFSAFEEKRIIYEILNTCIEKDSVQIFVGSEIGMKNINELGLVTRSYSRDGNIIGMVGVIGPKRMQYPSVVSIVDYSAKLISNFLNEFFEGK